MLKALIGLAAIAVIAFVGYFFWGEWQRGQAAALAAEQARGEEIAACAMLAVNLERARAGENLGFRFSQTDAAREVAVCQTKGLLDESAMELVRGMFAR